MSELATNVRGLHLQWYERGRQLLRKIDLSAEELEETVVKDWLIRNAIKAVAGRIAEHPSTKDLDTTVFAGKLGVNRSTVYRWEVGQSNPVTPPFMGALLALKVGFPDLELEYEKMVFAAASETVKQICGELLHGPNEGMSALRLAAVHFYIRDRQSHKFDLERPGDYSPELAALLSRVLDETRSRFYATTTSPAELLTVVRQWHQSYLLFRLALEERGWDVFDGQ